MELTRPFCARKVAPLVNEHRRAATVLVQNLKAERQQRTPTPKGERSNMNPEFQWTVYRTRFLVRARQLTEPLVFTDALGREQSGRPGDYLVESSGGVRHITTQTLFEDIYVPLAQSDGVPTALARPVARASPEDRARATA